jgi:hypothetical protein
MPMPTQSRAGAMLDALGRPVPPLNLVGDFGGGSMSLLSAAWRHHRRAITFWRAMVPRAR